MRYDEKDLALLISQEETAKRESFTSQDAYHVAQAILSLLPEYDRGIALRIVREKDGAVIFQYISDDKAQRNIGFAKRKQEVIHVYGHASASLYVKEQIEETSYTTDQVLASSGSFPIYNHQNVLIASILISGLHHGQDHELLIRGLEKADHKSYPKFTKPLD
jgi:uncharacterized protein (UPF0303 family)